MSDLRMYALLEDGVTEYVVARSKDEAWSKYVESVGMEVVIDFLGDEYGDEEKPADIAIREMDQDDVITYYSDGKRPEKNAVKNIIAKYADGPCYFACSEF
jgi:hypothetical protein